MKRSRASLAGEEREKFDSYLEAYENLHARQTDLVAREQAIRRHAPKLDGKLPVDQSSLVLEAQTEIAAAALAARLTNVVTLASGVGSQQEFGRFPEFGIKNLQAIGNGGSQGDKTSEACFIELRQFHCKLITRLVAALSAVKEGPGTAMDST